MRTSIQYEDKDILVVYKPAGLATQTAKVDQADVVSELKNYLKGGYVGVVHRLDQPVEGLLVFGKTKEATAALTAQLSRGILHKHYYAVICGQPGASKEKLVDYLVKTADNLAQVVEPAEGTLHSGEISQQTGNSTTSPPKKAVLQYEIIDSLSRNEETGDFRIALADIHIETGRFHQIRAQMSHAGMPLLGDRKYGNDLSARVSRSLNVRNVALCACELTLEHPKLKKKLNFQVKPQGIIFTRFSILNQ